MLNKKEIKMDRRLFIKSAGLLGATAAVAACAPQAAPTAAPAEAPAAEPTAAEPAVPESDAPPVEASESSNMNLEQIARLSDQKIEVSGFSSPLYVATDVATFNDQVFDQKMEELTNVHIGWQAAADWGDAPLELLMASGDLPDVIAGYSLANFASYGQKGALAPLDEYITTQPYLAAWMKKMPQLKALLTAPDGHIYAYPRILEGKTAAFAGFFIRQDWLDEVGMAVPETVDDYYNVLKAFKEKDPNRYPYTRDPRALIWQWGVGSRGPNVTTDFYHDKDVVKYGPIQPEYREALVYIAKLYSEGLIDNEYQQSMSSDDFFFQRFADGISGASMQWSLDGIVKSMRAQDPEASLVGTVPPKGPYGHREILSNHFIVDPTQATAIAATSANKDTLAKYMDAYYSDSGETLMNWGLLGEHYTEADGERVYTDLVTKDEKLTPAEYLWNWVSPTWIGAMVVDEEQIPQMYQETDLQAINVWSVPPWQTIQLPPLFLTEDEEATIEPILNDVNTLVDENINAFITGTKNLEGDYDDMVAQIKARGIDDVTAVYQAAYDRFLAASS